MKFRVTRTIVMEIAAEVEAPTILEAGEKFSAKVAFDALAADQNRKVRVHPRDGH